MTIFFDKKGCNDEKNINIDYDFTSDVLYIKMSNDTINYSNSLLNDNLTIINYNSNKEIIDLQIIEFRQRLYLVGLYIFLIFNCIYKK